MTQGALFKRQELQEGGGRVTIRGARLLMLRREAIMHTGSMRTGAPHRFKMRPLIAMLLGAGICGSPLLAHAEKNPLRDVFFGETHLHTSWSFDAYVFGNTLTGPEEAYQYALGKPIRHPAGYMVQIKRPLDFEAVTDHSEYMGTVRLANDPQSDLSKLPIAEKLKVRSKEDMQKVYLFLATSHHHRADQGADQP